MKISGITIAGKPQTFQREQQIISILFPLQPNESQEVKIEYRGTLSPTICYAEMEHAQEQTEARNYYQFNLGRDFFYLDPEFTLLTPEILWYPTCLPPVNIRSPYTTLQSYTRFHLAVIGEKKHTPISQGTRSIQGDTTWFQNKQDIPGLTLCIGDYTRKSITVDSTLYELYLFKGHEYLTVGFTDPKEIITFWSNNLGYKNNAYVFNKMSFVESPIHFCAYSRYWKTGSEYIQPEIIFRPEREALLPYAFKIKSAAINTWMTPQLEYFQTYQRNYDISRDIYDGNLLTVRLKKRNRKRDTKNEYDISSLIQKHHLHVTSSEFQGINLLFQQTQGLWELVNHCFREHFDPVEAVGFLKDQSFSSLLASPQDPLLLNKVLWSKSCAFLKRVLCSVPYQEFYDFNREFITHHAFQEVNYEQYCTEFKNQFGLDLLSITRQLYNEEHLPVFLIREVRIDWVESSPGRKAGYVQSVKVWNKSQIDGVITLTGSHFPKDAHYLIPAGSCKEIRHYVADQPEYFELEIFTGLAQNLPAYYAFNDIRPERIIQNPRPGVFDADTALFLPPANEYIVDNEDADCHIIEAEQALTRHLREKNKSAIPGTHWTIGYNADSYGEPVRSYYWKKAGSGETKIEWNTQLPKDGEYDIYIYNNESIIRNNTSIRKVINGKMIENEDPLQTYSFTHAEGREEIILKMKDLNNGWNSLGKYRFPAGDVKLTLLDRGAEPDQSIIADAVKWVKCK